MRVGMGYDVHRLAENRKLVLGGVEIPHTAGLLGHSDADVAVHAVMDALLGAAALGDIGKHFPDTDEKYAGISSLKLLAHVGRLLEKEQYVIENIDVTIVAQKPKLRDYISQMEQRQKKGWVLQVRSRGFLLMLSVRSSHFMTVVLRLQILHRIYAHQTQIHKRTVHSIPAAMAAGKSRRGFKRRKFKIKAA